MNAARRNVHELASGNAAISGVAAIRPTVSAFGRFIRLSATGRAILFADVRRVRPRRQRPRAESILGSAGNEGPGRRQTGYARDFKTSLLTPFNVSKTPSPV